MMRRLLTLRPTARTALRPFATVVPPPQPGANVEKMPGDGGAGGALSRADWRDASGSEQQAAAEGGAPLGPGNSPPPLPGSQPEQEKKIEEKEEQVIEVGPPVTAREETLEHDAGEPRVAPADLKQEGTATTTLKGQDNTMKAPESQSGG
jgi:hypothetical protein